MLSNKSDTDEKFYDDLDEKRSHGSCCTCQGMVLLFVGLLILSVVGVFYIYRQITAIKVPTINLAQNFSNKNFEQMITNLKPTNDGQIEIVLSENDLSSFLSNGLSFQNFALQDTQAAINSNEIIVYGSLIRPLSSKIVLGLTPKVENGKINFVVNSINAGNWKVPKFIAGQLSKGFSGSINNKFEPIYKIAIVNKIELQDRQMTITGKLK